MGFPADAVSWVAQWFTVAIEGLLILRLYSLLKDSAAHNAGAKAQVKTNDLSQR
jgi:hypothetical protein